MKKIIVAFAVVTVCVISIVTLSSFTTNKNRVADIMCETHTHVAAQGKHCNYTVGCSCSGFAPKTNGDVWEEAYCKRCGHHKRYHK